MPALNRDLYGSVPDKSEVALLLIDVINDLEFPEGDQLLRYAQTMARQIAALKRRARENHVPTIYVNDNFGLWRSDFHAQVTHCLKDNVRGRSIAELLGPSEEDYFVLKPKHSGFFSTTLDILLQHLGVESIILTGMATNICVLFTANDAYMRDYRLLVPADCVAAENDDINRLALDQIEQVLKADISPSTEISFEDFQREALSST